MAKNFKELQARMSPERQARNARAADEILDTLPLYELRRARRMTQTEVAGRLQMSQSEVSRLERRADVYLSTLRRYISSLGGELQIRAIFDDREVVVSQLAEAS